MHAKFETKLDAIFNRFTLQMHRFRGYLQATATAIMSTGDEDAQEFYFQALIVMLLASVDDYLTALVRLAALHDLAAVRRYFETYGKEETRARVAAGCSDRELLGFVDAEASFRKEAKKLVRVYDSLIGCSPFPDNETKSYLLDLVLVRNVIVHHGGSPEPSHAEQARIANVFVLTAEVRTGEGHPPIPFYQLRLRTSLFLYQSLQAIEDIVQHLRASVKENPKFKL